MKASGDRSIARGAQGVGRAPSAGPTVAGPGARSVQQQVPRSTRQVVGLQQVRRQRAPQPPSSTTRALSADTPLVMTTNRQAATRGASADRRPACANLLRRADRESPDMRAFYRAGCPCV